MELFSVLFKIAIILFAAYSFFIILYRMIYNVSLDDAEKAVSALVVESMKNMFFNKTPDTEPQPNKVLIENLFLVLQDTLHIDRISTRYHIASSCGFYVIYFDVVKGFDDTFSNACIKLEKTLYNYWETYNYTPVAYAYFEQHDDNQFYFYCCYACTNNCQTALQNYMNTKCDSARKDAVNKEMPVINSALEKEIEEMKKSEKNEKF